MLRKQQSKYLCSGHKSIQPHKAEQQSMAAFQAIDINYSANGNHSSEKNKDQVINQKYEKAKFWYSKGRFYTSNIVIDQILETTHQKDQSITNMTIFKFLNYICDAFKFDDFNELCQSFQKVTSIIVKNECDEQLQMQKLLFVCTLTYHFILSKAALTNGIYYSTKQNVDVSCVSWISNFVQMYHLQFVLSWKNETKTIIKQTSQFPSQKGHQRIKVFEAIMSQLSGSTKISNNSELIQKETLTKVKRIKILPQESKLYLIEKSCLPKDSEENTYNISFPFYNLRCIFVKLTSKGNNWLGILQNQGFLECDGRAWNQIFDFGVGIAFLNAEVQNLKNPLSKIEMDQIVKKINTFLPAQKSHLEHENRIKIDQSCNSSIKGFQKSKQFFSKQQSFGEQQLQQTENWQHQFKNYGHSYVQFQLASKFDRGIANIGNTCYMNCVLQCLHKSSYFTQYLKTTKHLIGKQSKMAQEIKLFLLNMPDQNERFFDKPFNAQWIKKQVEKSNFRFEGHRQNDSIQFFSTLLSILDYELNTSPLQKNYNNINHYESIQKIYQQTKKNDENRSKSICDQTFTGRYQVTYNCLECNSNYVLFQKFNIHYLEIPGKVTQSSHLSIFSHQNKPQSSLQQCLGYFQHQDLLEGDNKMTCDKCKIQTANIKTMKIYQANKILVVGFKRFLNGRKDRTVVDIPHKLAVKDVLANHQAPQYQNKKYRLYAAILHLGDLYGGHYTAVCFNYLSRKWVNYSDSHVRNVQSLDLSNAYVLFYQLIQEGFDDRETIKITSNRLQKSEVQRENLTQDKQKRIYSDSKARNQQQQQSCIQQNQLMIAKKKSHQQQSKFYHQVAQKKRQSKIYPKVSVISNDLASLDCVLRCLMFTQYFSDLFSISASNYSLIRNDYERLLCSIFLLYQKDKQTYFKQLQKLQDFISTDMKDKSRNLSQGVFILTTLMRFFNQFRGYSAIGVQIEQAEECDKGHVKKNWVRTEMLQLPIQKANLLNSLKTYRYAQYNRDNNIQIPCYYCNLNLWRLNKKIIKTQSLLIIRLDKQQHETNLEIHIPKQISPQSLVQNYSTSYYLSQTYYQRQVYALRAVLCFNSPTNKTSAYVCNTKNGVMQLYSNGHFEPSDNSEYFRDACAAIYQLVLISKQANNKASYCY